MFQDPHDMSDSAGLAGPHVAPDSAAGLGYMGRKSQAGVWQRIIAHMPPHDVYIETHLGTGKVLAEKPPARVDIGIEIDEAVIRRFRACYPKQARIICADWMDYWEDVACEMVAGVSQTDRILYYHDTPYHPDTWDSSRGYKYNYTAAQLEAFLAAICEASGLHMVSGYWHPLYDQYLTAARGWRRIDYQVRTRGRVRTESLWMNYPEGVPHWHVYAGKDAEDRVRIRRKGARWGKAIAALPPGERAAILQWVIRSADAENNRETR